MIQTPMIFISQNGEFGSILSACLKWKIIIGEGTQAGRMLYVLLDRKPLIVNGENIEGYLGDLEKEYEVCTA